MKGYFLIYKKGSAINITQAHQRLVGRILSLHTSSGLKRYYYEGLLKETKYLKLYSGCYFSTDKVNLPYLHSYECDLAISSNQLTTAHDVWRKKITSKGWEVINFVKT